MSTKSLQVDEREIVSVDAAPGPVTPATIVRFVAGGSDSIWRIATAKRGWLLGAVFVLTAGLAREYDRSDLWAEPQHLLLPFGASLVGSLLLFGLVTAFANAKAPAHRPSYLEFLQTYWATAPLAWLYALPVERWFNAADAVSANFWLLGIVAAWRVVLMIRIVQTLWGADRWSSAAIVFAFGDGVLILALWFSPMPVLDVMAGNRLSPAEQALQSAHLRVGILAWLSLPIWLIGLVLTGLAAKWNPVSRPTTPTRPIIAGSAWALAGCAVFLGGVLCLWEQPKQGRATAIRNFVAEQQYQSALDRLATLSPADFPPHWDLPPNPNYVYAPEEPQHLVRFFLTALESPQTSIWVQTQLTRKVIRSFTSPYLADQMVQVLSDEELELVVTALESAHGSGEHFPRNYHGLAWINTKEKPHRAELVNRLGKLYENED